MPSSEHLELPEIEIYVDGADLEHLGNYLSWEWVRGVTTNPTLLRSAGVRDVREFAARLIPDLRGRPLSIGVTAEQPATAFQQAVSLSQLGENLFVKVPIIDSAGASNEEFIHDLVAAGMRINVTCLHTLAQCERALAALKGAEKGFVSIFAGRIADTGRDPRPSVRALVRMARERQHGIKVLWASTRQLFDIDEAAACGAHVITVPFAILDKIHVRGMDLDAATLTVVRQFATATDSLTVGTA
jgi:transaldolase